MSAMSNIYTWCHIYDDIYDDDIYRYLSLM